MTARARPREPRADEGGGGAAGVRPALALRALKAALVVAVVLGAATLRVVVAGEREIAASTAALRAAAAPAAPGRPRRAAGWYAPGAPHVRVAYERMIALAVAAEGLGDRDTALSAWRSVRTAATETRWIVTPHAEDLARADAAIARLSAAAPRPPGTRTEPASAIERAQLEALARDEAPRVPWVIALSLSFLGWAVGSGMAARRAVSATGHVAWQRASPWLVVAGGGVLLWLIALWRA